MKDTSTIIKQNLELRKENIRLKKENEELKKELKITKAKLDNAYRTIKRLEEKHEQYVVDEAKRIEDIVNKVVAKVTKELNKEHEKEVKELKAQISRLEKRLNIQNLNYRNCITNYLTILSALNSDCRHSQQFAGAYVICIFAPLYAKNV